MSVVLDEQAAFLMDPERWAPGLRLRSMPKALQPGRPTAPR